MKLALVGARILDGTGSAPTDGSTVLIDDGKIVGIERHFDADTDTLAVDASRYTVMPGVIDSHVHYAPWAQWLVTHTEDRLMNLACQTVDALRLSLEAGVTTARDLGGLEAGFVEAADSGLILSPRLQSCVTIIHPTNGVLDNMPSRGGTTSKMGNTLRVPGMPAPYCSGPWEAREKVREIVRSGANVIKMATSSQRVNGVMQWDMQTFNEEEISAICDEAHRMGLKVTSHARGRQGVLAAVQCGVDGIEHGGDLDDDVLNEMARRGIWLIPTLFITAWHAANDPEEVDRLNAQQRLELTSRTLIRAQQLGVPIAMGSDGGLEDPTAGIAELALMADAGMSAADVIVAATSGAARWLGVADRVGTVEVGKAADLLMVAGDPLADLRSLQGELGLVTLGGRPVGGRLRHAVADGLLGGPTIQSIQPNANVLA